MMMGHYATALIPWGKQRTWPLWLLLVCGQWGDLLWFVLAIFGVEPTEPANPLDMTVANLTVPMFWSHGLVSAGLQAVVVAVIVALVWKNRALGLTCGALIVGHVLCDGVVGWKHEMLGAGSARFGLGLFENPSTIVPAFLIEAVFSSLCVWLFVRFRAGAISNRARLILYAVFVVGGLMFAGNATTSLRQMFGG
ncbi:MAG: hypothetical protein QM817_07045 [Archangium sp.]